MATAEKEEGKEPFCPMSHCRSKDLEDLGEGEYRCRICGVEFKIIGWLEDSQEEQGGEGC